MAQKIGWLQSTFAYLLHFELVMQPSDHPGPCRIARIRVIDMGRTPTLPKSNILNHWGRCPADPFIVSSDKRTLDNDSALPIRTPQASIDSKLGRTISLA